MEKQELEAKLLACFQACPETTGIYRVAVYRDAHGSWHIGHVRSKRGAADFYSLKIALIESHFAKTYRLRPM